MNIEDWQRAKEALKRSSRKFSTNEVSQGPRSVPAKLDVLEAELRAIASRPPQDEGKTAEEANS